MLIGVDSASAVDDALLELATRTIGRKPAFWGRYLTDGGVGATPVTRMEVDYLNSHDIAVALIYNGPILPDGLDVADKAVSACARLLGKTPLRTTIFADIERGVNIDAGWLLRFHNAMTGCGFRAGIYAPMASPMIHKALFVMNETDIVLWDAHWLVPLGRMPTGPQIEECPAADLGIRWQLRQIAGNVAAGKLDVNLMNGNPTELGLLVPQAEKQPAPQNTAKDRLLAIADEIRKIAEQI